MRVATAFCIAVLAASCSGAQDDYLQATRDTCLSTGAFMDCAKYKVVNLVHRIASTPRSYDLGPLRLVGVPQSNSTEDSLVLSRAATYSSSDPEPLKLLRYGLRQAHLFAQSHGLSLPLSALGGAGGGAHLVYDDGTVTSNIGEEGRGRNAQLIVPLMIMAKLMTIKALLIPTLLGVAAIKKFIVLSVMALPTLLHKLRVCRVMPHTVHYTPHHSHEYHDDYLPHHETTHHGRRRMGWLTPIKK